MIQGPFSSQLLFFLQKSGFHQLIASLSHYLRRLLYISGGCLEFLSHQQYVRLLGCFVGSGWIIGYIVAGLCHLLIHGVFLGVISYNPLIRFHHLIHPRTTGVVRPFRQVAPRQQFTSAWSTNAVSWTPGFGRSPTPKAGDRDPEQ